MQVRCNIDPLVCGYYQGGYYQGGCCPLSGGVCEGAPAAESGLKIKCYLDPDACKHFRGGTCQRFCCDCAAVHVDEIVEDGEE